jgi:hypothetical protein
VCITDAVETVEVCCEAEEDLMILSRLFQPEKVGPRSICGVQERHFRLSDQRDKKYFRDCQEKTASPSKIKLQKCERIEIS